MGVIGLLLTVVIMVLGAGYFYFGTAGTTLTVTNDAPAPVLAAQGLAAYETMKEKANTAKSAAEESAKEAAALLQEGAGPEVPVVDTTKKETPLTALKIIDRLMGSGFAVPTKDRIIDTIAIHSSYDPNGKDPYSVEALVKIYEGYGVSAHYLIDRGGTIYRLVKDQNIAYHAGASKMPDGRTNVNDFSIGIELMNKETTECTSAQYVAVNALIAQLKKGYTIKNIVGHSDIAPGRKTDPWNFDWKKLK